MKEINLFLLLSIVAIIVVVLLNNGGCSKNIEGYRDPIYLNRQKLDEWYEKTNGSIYGYPYGYGGNWSIMSGFPYYDRAY